MEYFDNLSAFIIDMDGVLWHGNKAMSGLVDFFNTLRKRQIRFILATNNASLTPEQYVTKLANMGVEVALSEILTSGMATAFYLKEHFDPATTTIFVVGEAGASMPLLAVGFKLSDNFDSGRADIVVCGKDEGLTWAKLADASLNLSAGALFYGTNADISLPTERGVTLGNGAILAALETATAVKPFIIGKPEAIFYQQALLLLGVEPSHAIAIGDRLDTDILGAVRTGIRSILVLTGISAESDFENLDYQPTWVLPDIAAITQLLQQD